MRDPDEEQSNINIDGWCCQVKISIKDTGMY